MILDTNIMFKVQSKLDLWAEEIKELTGAKHAKLSIIFPEHAENNKQRGEAIIAQVLKAVESETGFTLKDLVTQNRKVEVMDARKIALHMIRDVAPGVTLVRLGELLKRDHTTIISAIRSADEFLTWDEDFINLYHKVKGMLVDNP